METKQIRLTKQMLKEIGFLVDRGIYSSVSEAIRDAVRRLVTGQERPLKLSPEEKKVEEIKEKIEEAVKGKLKRAPGTKDFLPEQQILRQEIVDELKRIFELYGYSPLETPALERYEILASKYAGGSEILKETFKLRDQGNRLLGLRYDLTVPLARVIGMNPQLRMPLKRYQIGNVFRDGPISLARYRQFMQCDADIVGCKEKTAEAEIIAMANGFFKKLGLDIRIRVNNRKILNEILDYIGIAKEKQSDIILSIDKLDNFGLDAVKKELVEKGVDENNVDKIIKTISIGGDNNKKIKELGKIIKGDGLKEIKEFLEYVNVFGVDVEFDIALARGLSYYTGTIFEIFLINSKVKSAVAAGGRYDNMISEFLGRGFYPAVGISFGIERIYDSLLEKNKTVKKTVTQLYIIPIGEIKEGLKIAEKLRKEGINVEIDLGMKGPSKNLGYANRLGIPYVLFIGQDEIKKKKVKLRDMKTGKEELIGLGKVKGKVKS